MLNSLQWFLRPPSSDATRSEQHHRASRWTECISVQSSLCWNIGLPSQGRQQCQSEHVLDGLHLAGEVYKINFDGAMYKEEDRASIGVIINDCHVWAQGTTPRPSVPWQRKLESPCRLGLRIILGLLGQSLTYKVCILDYVSEIWVQLGKVLGTQDHPTSEPASIMCC